MSDAIHKPNAVPDANSALAGVLRGQVMDRVRSQEQFLVVTAAVGGGAAAFGGEWLHSHASVIAFLALLFVTLALAMLRQDQEIATIALHLIDEDAFGADGAAQQRWERHKLKIMAGNSRLRRIAVAAQVLGVYGVPVGAYIACVVAALHVSRSAVVWSLLVPSFVLFLLLLVGGAEVYSRYKNLRGP